MSTLTPRQNVRASYTPAALEQASESLAGRSTIYRLFRGYYQWSLRGSNAQRVFLVVTGVVAARVPALRPILQPFAILQALFIVLSWLGPPIMDVFLCLDSQVRQLIPPWRRKGAMLTGLAIATAVGLTVPAFMTEAPAYLFAAFCAWAITFPASAVYRLPAGFPRAAQTVALIVFIGCAVGGFMMPDETAGKVMAGVCVVGCILSARMTVKAITDNPMNRR